MRFTILRRDVALVVGAKAVSLLGDEVATLALVLRSQGHGGGAGAVAAILMANLIPIVALSGVVGRLVDRHDNRIVLISSSVTQALVCAFLAFVSDPTGVLALVALLGVGQAVNGATWQALLPSLVPPTELARTVGVAQAASTVAGIAAPALGGLLTGLYGARVPLLLDAATFVVVTAAAVLVRHRRATAAPTPGERLRGGLAIVRHDPMLRAVFVLLAASVLLGSLVNVVEVFLVRVTLGADAVWYGVCSAAYMAGLLGGALGAGRLATVPAQARWFVASAAAISVGLVTMGLAPTIVWLVVFGLLTGVANGVLNVCLSTLVLGRAAAETRGRVAALLGGVVSGSQLVAYAAGGALASVLSPRAIFVAAGCVGMLGPLLFARAVLRAARPSTARSSDGSAERRTVPARAAQ